MMPAGRNRARSLRSLALLVAACALLLLSCDEGAYRPASLPAVPRAHAAASTLGSPLTPQHAGALASPTALPRRGAPAVATPPGTSAPDPATQKIVAIDPGHGGPVQTGAVSAQGLAEKTVNLRIALRLAALLRAGGFKAVLTRTSDSPVNARGLDLNADGRLTNDDDLQARVDIANAAHADILVSIHNNGALDRTVGGTRTYYEDTRPFSALSRRLAGDIQRNMVASIQAAGYPTKDWGALTDEPLKKPYGHLFLLGPANPRVARPSRMPGALGETLYLSNPREAALLATPEMQQAIALGYYRGIVAYFQDGAASLGTGH